MKTINEEHAEIYDAVRTITNDWDEPIMETEGFMSPFLSMSLSLYAGDLVHLNIFNCDTITEVEVYNSNTCSDRVFDTKNNTYESLNDYLRRKIDSVINSFKNLKSVNGIIEKAQ